jgi:hypothetical protein
MLKRFGLERRRALAVRGLAAIVVLGLACSRSGAQSPASPAGEALSLDLQVTFEVDVGARKVRVEPEVFLQRLGGGVTFVAKGLAEGYTLEIDFKAQGGARGPFAKGQGSLARGRYTLSAKTPSLPSGRSDSAAPGVWKYEVVLRDAKGDDLVAIDPMGVLK